MKPTVNRITISVMGIISALLIFAIWFFTSSPSGLPKNALVSIDEFASELRSLNQSVELGASREDFSTRVISLTRKYEELDKFTKGVPRCISINLRAFSVTNSYKSAATSWSFASDAKSSGYSHFAKGDIARRDSELKQAAESSKLFFDELEKLTGQSPK